MANLTGGTAAPTIRMNAAARVLGAPKVVGQKQQRSTPAARPPRMPARNAPALPHGQGITQHQATPQRPVGQHQAQREAAAHRPPAPKAAPAKAGLDPMQEYKTGKYADPAEIQKIATRMTENEDKAQMTPYKQEGREIGSAESNALARNQALAAAAQPNLQAIQSEGEASAKTGENNAAEAAVAAAKSIETTGQSAATANGGYTAPQVASALGQAGAQAGALGGAASQYQSAMGAGGTSFMTAMRAAAADRASEGATRLQQGYGAAQTKNTQEGDKTLSRLVPGQEKRALELPEEQVKDNVALRDVGAKEGTVKVNAAKVSAGEREDRAKNTTAERDTQAKDQTSLLTTQKKDQTSLEKQGIANAGALSKERIKAKTSLEVANKKAGRLTTSEEDKLTGELSDAYATIQQKRTQGVTPQQIRNALTTGSETVEQGGKPVKVKNPTIKNQVLVTAALEAWDYHKVSPVTAKQLAALGIQSVPKVENGQLVFG
jgi:hypothetical protein